MRICGRPKIPTSLSRQKCKKSSILTSEQGFWEIRFWDRWPYLLPERLNGVKYFVFLQHVLPNLKEYRLLCARTCGLCKMAHQYIFRLLTGAILLDLHAPRMSMPMISSSEGTRNHLFIRRLWIHGRISQHESSLFHQTSRAHHVYLNAWGTLSPSVSAVQWQPQLRTIIIKIIHRLFSEIEP